jgi:RNA polymerase sigma factor (sigma-70 family)
MLCRWTAKVRRPGKTHLGSPVIDFAVMAGKVTARVDHEVFRYLSKMHQPAERADHLGRLMRLAQDGDRVAYRELLKQIVPLLRRWLKRRRPFLSASDIEDVVQDVLLAVHAVRATYDRRRPFLPWLMAIAHNRSVDAARRYGRLRAREIGVEEYPETSHEQQTNMREETYGDPEALRSALGALPEGQRKAIELVKLQEMSLREAAAVSGMSIGALKVATHRATRTLRLALRTRDGRGH